MQATGMAAQVVVQDSMVIQEHLPTSRGKAGMVCILVNYLAITGATKAGLQAEVEVDLIQRRIITAEALALLAAEEDRTKEAFMSDEGLMAYPNQEAGEDLAARVMARLQGTEDQERFS